MEAAPAALAGSSSSLPPPETIVPPRPRGQKRGVPDEDDAAGDGAARGSPRRAAGAGAVVEEEEEEEEESSSMEFVEEEDDDYDEPEVFYARPDRQLLDFLRVHPCAAAATGAGAMAGQAHQEPKPVVDVTLRLGVGPLADADDTEVDTTLSLRLGPAPPPAAAAAAAMAEDGRRHFLPRGVPASIAALLGAPVPAVAPDAEPAAGSSDDRGGGIEVACRVVLAGPSDQQSLPHFFDVDDYAIDCFAVGYANDGGAAGRPSSSGVMDMNKPCRSGSGSPDDVDGKPDPPMVPDPAAAEVGERRRPLMPFDDDDFFCSRVLIDDYT